MIEIFKEKIIIVLLLPGTPFSESALSECVLESELDVEEESSSSGSSLTSEFSSNILKKMN